MRWRVTTGIFRLLFFNESIRSCTLETCMRVECVAAQIANLLYAGAAIILFTHGLVPRSTYEIISYHRSTVPGH